MEIKLIFNDEDMLAALISTWRSVRRLPQDLHIPIAQKLLAEDYPEYAERSEIIAEMMAALFSLLAGHLDPEILRQWDEADAEGMEMDGSYLYEPAVREHLIAMGLDDLANTKFE